MSDKSMDPGASPDLLAPPSKKGQGVRRVNKVPLLIVFGLVAAAVLAITYTYYDRQEQAQQRQVKEAAPPDTVVEAATPAVEVPRESEATGYIAPAPEFEAAEIPSDIPAASDPVTDAPRTAAATATPVLTEQQVAAIEQRRQLIQRIQEGKLADLERALGEESTIEVGGGAASASPLAVAVPAPAGGDLQRARAAAMEALRGGAGADHDPNGQAAKREFLRSNGAAENYLPYTRTPALSQFEVKAGAVIPGVMISGLNSDLPGQIIAQVRENVYDSATGRFLLIPMGARLIGTYDNAVTFGQDGALTAWTRIIYPDGSSVNLGTMPGADREGYAGFRDQVNNHYGRIYGSAFLLSIFSAGTQLSQPSAPAGTNGAYDAQQILSAELGRQLGQLGVEQSRRSLDIAPTIEIRPGYKFNVMVTKDMVLAPYVD